MYCIVYLSGNIFMLIGLLLLLLLLLLLMVVEVEVELVVVVMVLFLLLLLLLCALDGTDSPQGCTFNKSCYLCHFIQYSV